MSLPTIPKLCGVKRSICCTLVSAWAIVMLSIMGGLLSIKSLAFIEDVAVHIDVNTTNAEFYENQDKAYDAAAFNCYLAFGMYIVTFVVSLYHWAAFQQKSQVVN